MADYNKMWEQLQGILGDIALAPARGMMAQPPEPQGMGILGEIHKAIDPVRAFGGYGNMAAMALPPGRPLTSAGKPRMRDHSFDELADVYVRTLEKAKASGRKHLTEEENFQLGGIEARVPKEKLLDAYDRYMKANPPAPKKGWGLW
jgi:hypothetical protein